MWKMHECLYICRPRGNGVAAACAAGVFFLGSVAFAAIGLNNQLRRLFFFTAAFMLIVFFLILNRFLATGYSYAVFLALDTGRKDIVIYEHTLANREPKVVCRIGVHEIYRSESYSGEKASRKRARAARRARKCSAFYNYSASVFERKYTIIYFTDGENECAVRLTYDSGLADMIRAEMLG